MPRKVTKTTDGAATCPLTGSTTLRAEADAQTASIKEQFPKGVSQPALRALYNAGYMRLEQLTEISEEGLLKLHGMGPKAVRIMREALQEQGLDYRQSK